MSQTSNERLREYLAQLPIQSQALLMREFERAIERGENAAVANLVLEHLRNIVRRDAGDSRPRGSDLSRVFFSPLDPFVVDGNYPARPGRIRRSSLLPVWQWIVREGAPEQASQYEAAFARSPQSGPQVEVAMRKLQTAAAEAILAIAGPGAGEHQRALARVGPPDVIDDLLGIGAALQGIEALERLGGRIPIFIRAFSDSQVISVSEALNVAPLQTPLLLPFAISSVMQRLAAPWSLPGWRVPTTRCG
jgi:hypothetical protein